MLKDVAHRLLAGNFLKVDRHLEVCGGYTRRSSVVEMLKRRVSPRSRRSSVILDTLPKIAGEPCVEWISYPRGTADVFNCPRATRNLKYACRKIIPIVSRSTSGTIPTPS